MLELVFGVNQYIVKVRSIKDVEVFEEYVVYITLVYSRAVS